jgi:hypothetical protein
MAKGSSGSEAELDDFIRIIGVNKDKTTIVHHNVNIHSVPFILNKNPPFKWKFIFNQQNYIYGPSTLREAVIEGEYIIVKCRLPEIKEFILDELKKKVSETNIKYHESIQSEMKEILDNPDVKTEDDFMDIDDAVNGLEF